MLSNARRLAAPMLALVAVACGSDPSALDAQSSGGGVIDGSVNSGAGGKMPSGVGSGGSTATSMSASTASAHSAGNATTGTTTATTASGDSSGGTGGGSSGNAGTGAAGQGSTGAGNGGAAAGPGSTSAGNGGAAAGPGSTSAGNGGATAGPSSASSTTGISSSGATGSSASSSGTGSSTSAGAGGSGVTFPPNCTCLNLGPPACTPTGHVTYTLAMAAAPTAEQQSAYDAILCAMDGAIAYYNCNTTITKAENVSYVPSVATADGNFNGSIRFGPDHSYMECVTAMHEIAHTVGVGTAPKWSTFSVGGVFTGATAIAQLRAITGNATDVLHSDTQHFWPYGLNYTSEAKSTADLIDHTLMVTAIRKDLGL